MILFQFVSVLHELIGIEITMNKVTLIFWRVKNEILQNLSLDFYLELNSGFLTKQYCV